MRSFLRIGLVSILTLATAVTGVSPVAAAQTAPAIQNQIPQQIIINGQTVNGAYVLTANGGMQSYTCPNPQEYVTADGASRGWTCFDSTSNVWLLNALPPAQSQVAPQPAPQTAPPPPPAITPQNAPVYQAPPPVVYTQPTVIYTTPYPAYPAYPAYPVVVAPAYPPSVILGAAAINAFGRIASAAIISSHHGYYYPYPVRVWRR
jgi:hypothetical protein